ncbi:MAG: ribosome maturation factor RimP [Bacteroidota bacterium]
MNLQEIRSIVTESVLPILSQRDAFLVDLQLRMERKSVLIQLFVDTDAGITIQGCADLSREMIATLDKSRLFGDNGYRLEVSSPGIDRPLKLLRQYHKNIGRKFKVRFRQGTEEKVLSGSLIAIQGDQLTFAGPAEGSTISLPFDEIVESREELPW